MEEELISSSNTEYEDEFKYSPNNTYIIQSFVDGTDMPDKSSLYFFLLPYLLILLQLCKT